MGALLALLSSPAGLVIVTLIGKWIADATVKALPVKANSLVEGVGSVLVSIGTALSKTTNAVQVVGGSVVSTVGNAIVAAEQAKQPVNPLNAILEKQP